MANLALAPSHCAVPSDAGIKYFWADHKTYNQSHALKVVTWWSLKLVTLFVCLYTHLDFVSHNNVSCCTKSAVAPQQTNQPMSLLLGGWGVGGELPTSSSPPPDPQNIILSCVCKYHHGLPRLLFKMSCNNNNVYRSTSCIHVGWSLPDTHDY